MAAVKPGGFLLAAAHCRIPHVPGFLFLLI
jgi:hypothetical protein